MTHLYPFVCPVKKSWPLCNGASSATLVASATVVGSIYFDPKQWIVNEVLTRTVIFRVSFNTTDLAITASVRLYDVDGITNAGVPRIVPASTLTTTSTTPSYQTVDLSATLGITTSGGLIEIHAYIGAEDPAYATIIQMAELSVSWA